MWLQFSGDFVGRVTPVPIPNTEVKPVGADDTAWVPVWESRKLPDLFQIKARSSKLTERAFFIDWLVVIFLQRKMLQQSFFSGLFSVI